MVVINTDLLSGIYKSNQWLLQAITGVTFHVCPTCLMEDHSLVQCKKLQLKQTSIPNLYFHPLGMDQLRLWMDRGAVVILGQIELMAYRVSSNLERPIPLNITEWLQWLVCISNLMGALIKFQMLPLRNRLNNKPWLKEGLAVLQRTRANWDLQVQLLLQLNRCSKLNKTKLPTKTVLSIIKVSFFSNSSNHFVVSSDMIGAN